MEFWAGTAAGLAGHRFEIVGPPLTVRAPLDPTGCLDGNLRTPAERADDQEGFKDEVEWSCKVLGRTLRNLPEQPTCARRASDCWRSRPSPLAAAT